MYNCTEYLAEIHCQQGFRLVFWRVGGDFKTKVFDKFSSHGLLMLSYRQGYCYIKRLWCIVKRQVVGEREESRSPTELPRHTNRVTVEYRASMKFPRYEEFFRCRNLSYRSKQKEKRNCKSTVRV